MARRRTRVSLGKPPEDPASLAGFPRVSLDPGEVLWRAVRKGRGPWWFDSSADGRFSLPEPEGTCYLAADEVAALLEVIGPDRIGGVVSREFIAQRGLRKLSVPSSVSIADLNAREAAGYGITLEIHTVVPYDRPREWAVRLRQSGAGGLRYLVRHDPSARRGVALFGRSGERTSWRRGRELAISDDLVERLAEDAGITIAAIPRANQLRVL